ncbi:MAG: LPS assembly lipoprotein LptE [Bryobacteraceae bacterium]
MKRRHSLSCLALLSIVLSAPGCGYHVAGRADLLPKSIKVIAIPGFQNATMRYKLAERLPGAVTREFLSRTRYDIVSDPNAADAILTGAVVNYFAYPTTFDPITNRAAGVQASVTLQVTLQERATGKVLFTRPSMQIRERYEISVDQRAYFEESDTAMERLSRDVARSLVSAILENF